MVLLLLIVIFLITTAFVWFDGLWSAAISLITVMLSGLVAMNYFEPLAAMFDGMLSSYTYFFDFLSLWILFVVTFAILRAIAGLLSKYRIRFDLPVEIAGRSILAVWVGWILVCFTCTTLHTAPLGRNSFGGSFQKDLPVSDGTVGLPGGLFLGMAPDRKWLGFVQSRSEGALKTWNPNPFDPKGEFIIKYRSRRTKLEQHVNQTGTMRVRK